MPQVLEVVGGIQRIFAGFADEEARQRFKARLDTYAAIWWAFGVRVANKHLAQFSACARYTSCTGHASRVLPCAGAASTLIQVMSGKSVQLAVPARSAGLTWSCCAGTTCFGIRTPMRTGTVAPSTGRGCHKQALEQG